MEKAPIYEKMDEVNVDESISYFEMAFGSSFRESPENNLSVAVLADAISLLVRDYVPPEARNDYLNTWQWLNGEYESHPGFSFDEIAERMGCDPDRLRKGIKAYIEESKGKTIKGLLTRAAARPLGDSEEDF